MPQDINPFCISPPVEMPLLSATGLTEEDEIETPKIEPNSSQHHSVLEETPAGYLTYLMILWPRQIWSIRQM